MTICTAISKESTKMLSLGRTSVVVGFFRCSIDNPAPVLFAFEHVIGIVSLLALLAAVAPRFAPCALEELVSLERGVAAAETLPHLGADSSSPPSTPL